MLLAIDTSSLVLSCALAEKDRLVAEWTVQKRLTHSEQLIPHLDAMMKEAGVSKEDITAIAVSIGPGSFTGLRIGCGIAQGLALAAGLPLIGIPTLDVLTHQHPGPRVLACLDARMGEVYWAEYTRDEQGVWHGEETEAVLKPEAVTERLQQLSGEWATVGTGWPVWPDMANDTGVTLVDGNMLLPAAEDMLPIACQLLAAGKTVAVEHAEPVYLRNTVAWKKLPGRE